MGVELESGRCSDNLQNFTNRPRLSRRAADLVAEFRVLGEQLVSVCATQVTCSLDRCIDPLAKTVEMALKPDPRRCIEDFLDRRRGMSSLIRNGQTPLTTLKGPELLVRVRIIRANCFR